MSRLRGKMLGVIAVIAISALAGCQNDAGGAGQVPANCAVPGSSCDRS